MWLNIEFYTLIVFMKGSEASSGSVLFSFGQESSFLCIVAVSCPWSHMGGHLACLCTRMWYWIQVLEEIFVVIVVFYSFGSHGQTCLSCFKKGKMTFDELKAVTDCIMSAPVLNNQVVRYCFCGYLSWWVLVCEYFFARLVAELWQLLF